jgi:hypothetical protein
VSQNLELQVHYEGIHRIDADTGERGEVVDEMQEAVVQCVDCMHDQPHLGFHNGRVEPVEDRWERMIVGTPWVASCTVTVDADDIETCSGPEAEDALADASFGEHGTREFFTHVRFHKHDEDRIVVHLLVELYSRSAEEATEVLEEAARGTLAITSRRSHARRRRPAATSTDGAPYPGGVSQRGDASRQLTERADRYRQESRHSAFSRTTPSSRRHNRSSWAYGIALVRSAGSRRRARASANGSPTQPRRTQKAENERTVAACRFHVAGAQPPHASTTARSNSRP